MGHYDIKLSDGTVIHHDMWRCFLCGNPMRKSGFNLNNYNTVRTKHHLKPQSVAEDVSSDIIYVHQACHKKIHQLFSNEELLVEYFDANILKVEFNRRLKLKLDGKYKNYNYRENL